MNTIDFFEKAKEYAQENYPDEYSDKANGSIVHAFVDGAIYATIGAWKEIDFRPNSENLDITALADELPIILFDENTMECVFADTSHKIKELLRSGRVYTQYMPTEYPFVVPLEELEENDESTSDNSTEDTNSEEDKIILQRNKTLK